jgi:catechol 2,3-dioxygenase-like lactoylglutathione lyase family enzyme
VLLDISHIGQIGFGVADIDRAEDFYGRALGLRKLFGFGDLAFFDCGGIRLLFKRSVAGRATRCTEARSICVVPISRSLSRN